MAGYNYYYFRGNHMKGNYRALYNIIMHVWIVDVEIYYDEKVNGWMGGF